MCSSRGLGGEEEGKSLKQTSHYVQSQTWGSAPQFWIPKPRVWGSTNCATQESQECVYIYIFKDLFSWEKGRERTLVHMVGSLRDHDLLPGEGDPMYTYPTLSRHCSLPTALLPSPSRAAPTALLFSSLALLPSESCLPSFLPNSLLAFSSTHSWY